MPEIKREVKPMWVEYACDECSKKPNPGCLLKRTKKVYLTHPEQHEYICENCKKPYVMAKCYPNIEYC